MIFFNQILSWFTSIFVFTFLIILLKHPLWFYWLVPVLSLLLILIVWQLSNRRFPQFLNFLISPLIFLESGILAIIFLDNNLIRYALIAGLSIFLGIYLKIIFLYHFSRPKYPVHSLENISSYLNLISLFLISSSFFGLAIFLSLPLWLLVLSLILISGLLTYQLFFVSDITFSKSIFYILISSLILAELFWVVSFLPTSIYVNGLILTLIYYLLTGLSRNWLLDIKEPKVVRRYLIISSLCLVLILLTAKWS